MYATKSNNYMKRGSVERAISTLYQRYEVDNRFNEGVKDLGARDEGRTIYEARMWVLRCVSEKIGVSLDDTQYDDTKSNQLIKKSDISDALSQLRGDLFAEVSRTRKVERESLEKPQMRRAEKLAYYGSKTIKELANELVIDLSDIEALRSI